MIFLLRRVPLLFWLLLPTLIFVAAAEWNDLRGFLAVPEDERVDLVGDDARAFAINFLSVVVFIFGLCAAVLSALRHPGNNSSLLNRLLDAGWREDRPYPTHYPFRPLSPSWQDFVALCLTVGYLVTIVPQLAIAVVVGFAIGLALQTWSIKSGRARPSQALSIFLAFAAIVATQVPLFGWQLAGVLSIVLIWLSRRQLHDVDSLVARLEQVTLSSADRPGIPFRQMALQTHAGFPHWGLANSSFARIPAGLKITGLVVGALVAYFAMVFINNEASPYRDRGEFQAANCCLSLLAIGLARVVSLLLHLNSYVGLWNRLRSGRLIVPKFDVIFLPILTAIALCCVWFFYGQSVTNPITVSITWAVMAATIMIVPPRDREKFILTGYGYVVRRGSPNQQQHSAATSQQESNTKPAFYRRISWLSVEFWLQETRNASKTTW